MSLIFATLFVSLGTHLPYFPLWLEAKGFHAEQIAIILAAPMFLRVVTTPLLTALADRAKDRADVYIALVAATMRLGVLFQHGALFSALTVQENVQVPMREYLDLPRKLMDELALLKIELVGLPPDAAQKFPSELSGGMTGGPPPGDIRTSTAKNSPSVWSPVARTV